MVERGPPRAPQQKPAALSTRSPRPVSFLNLPPATRHLARMSLSPRPAAAEPLLPAAPAAPASPLPAHTLSRLLPAALVALILLTSAVLFTPVALRTLPRFRPSQSPDPASATVADRLQRGYSVVAACKDRHQTLRRAALSWLNLHDVRQIVVVDWASQPPLRPILTELLAAFNATPPVLTVVRVENEPHWVLTRAYNLAVHHANYDRIFKVDCDYVMQPDAIDRHPLSVDTDSFFTGYYMNARDANEMHLNGALVISQRHFWSVGGYDERIQSYGYDDEDLYRRLLASGVTRLNVSYDAVAHVGHDDATRAQKHVKFPRVQIDVNSLLLEKLASPWSSAQHASEYKLVGEGRDSVRALFVPSPVEKLVSSETRDTVWKLALGRRLRDDYFVPWGVIGSMDVPTAEKLLQNLNTRKEEAKVDEVVHDGLAVRLLFVHVQNGLGNRLRVLASGLAFAARTRREPIVIWEKDVHFRGIFSDIFNASHVAFAVLNKFEPKWPLAGHAKHDAAWSHISFYNYLLPEGVGKPVVDDDQKNIYFKSSAIMNTVLTSWETENERLRQLKVHGFVNRMANQAMQGSFDGVGGVHIRNRSLDHDIEGVKDNYGLYSPEDAAEIQKWRATSKYTSFVGEMRELLKNGTVDRFFVATDTYQLLGRMQGMFPEGKVSYIKRDCDNRTGQCEQFAMADLLVLSRTKLLLGSTWSSFTEAAMRLGGPKALMAGTDFGPPPEGRR